MANYGFPCIGSKNTVANWIIDHIPACDNFYELFAGGCAVTHAAILSGKFKHIYANDIEETVQLFVDAINGRYTDEIKWISREDFIKNKKDDLYIRYIWSFFNIGATYFCSVSAEPYYKALHHLLVYNDNSLFKELGLEVPLMEFNTISERYTAWRNYCDKYPNVRMEFDQVSAGAFTYRLRPLENLVRLKELHLIKPYFNSKFFHVFNKDYRDVEVMEGSIVYLDPPYEGEFKTQELYTYIHEKLVPQTNLVVLSANKVNDPDLVCVARIRKQLNMNSIHDVSTEDRFGSECLYIPKEQVDYYIKNCILDWTGDL